MRTLPGRYFVGMLLSNSSYFAARRVENQLIVSPELLKEIPDSICADGLGALLRDLAERPRTVDLLEKTLLVRVDGQNEFGMPVHRNSAEPPRSRQEGDREHTASMAAGPVCIFATAHRQNRQAGSGDLSGGPRNCAA